ncbi:MAG: aspartate dehydrogenase [Lachnospira eligens]
MSIFRKKHTQSYDKMNKKPVLKTSICTGAGWGFQDIHTGKIEEIMLIKQAVDIDTFKQMYGIDGEIPKVY